MLFAHGFSTMELILVLLNILTGPLFSLERIFWVVTNLWTSTSSMLSKGLNLLNSVAALYRTNYV